jgi:hypothetical protein
MKTKKAQAWGIDLTIAVIIFTVGLVFFYFHSLNQPGQGEQIVKSLTDDGKIIITSILSEGRPENWFPGDVVKIGILTDNKIDETKLNRFHILASTPAGYAHTRNLFNTKYDYYFFLDKNMTIIGGSIEGIGEKPVSYDNLVKITRLTIYEDKPITAYLYMWE